MTADPISMPPFPFDTPSPHQDPLHPSSLHTLVASLTQACWPLVSGFPVTSPRSEACFWRAEEKKLAGKSRFGTRPQESESPATMAVSAVLGSCRSAGGFSGTDWRSGYTERLPSPAAGLWASQSTEDHWADASVSLASFCDLDVTKYPAVESCLKPEEKNAAAANVSIEDNNPEANDDRVRLQNDPPQIQEQQMEEASDDFAYSSEEEYWSCKEEDTNTTEDTRSCSRNSNFPPPISILATRRDSHIVPAASNRVFWQSIRVNGRLIVKEVNVCPQVYYHAHREDGRLRLYMEQPDSKDLQANSVEGVTEVQEDGFRAATEFEMQQDQEGDWAQTSLVGVETDFKHADEEENFSREEETESVMPEDLCKAWQEHLVLQRGETALWAASCPEKIRNPFENCVAACNGLNLANYMQDKAYKTVAQQEPAALLWNSRNSCEGARGLWAPTQSFLQKSLTRMRPVVG